jgi:hypothetical protein
MTEWIFLPESILFSRASTHCVLVEILFGHLA